jgi:isoquinoline 1-oxidoreductase beta subunit
VFGGKVKSFDGTLCTQIDGVIEVLEVPATDDPTGRRSGVAVVARDTWTAIRAREVLSVEWDTSEIQTHSTEDLLAEMTEKTLSKGELSLKTSGNVNQALRKAHQVIDAVYVVPFLAHAAMEPQNYTAHIEEDRAECWGPTQRPGYVGAAMVKEMTGIEPANTTVHQQRNGGGFGRRLLTDNVAEALFVSQQLQHAVQVLWTREDDFAHDYYRPMGMYRYSAGLDENNKATAWHLNAATTSRYLYRGSDSSPHGTEVFPDSFPAGFIPNINIEYTPIRTAVPTGAWRGPGHNAICLAEQGFLDELAHAAGRDPIDYRLEMLGDQDKEMPYDDHGGPTYLTNRLKGVIHRVHEISSWDNRSVGKRHLGFAAQFMFGAYVAQVVEVQEGSSSGGFNITRAFIVVDCGVVVNQSGAMAQAEGAFLDGINAAVYGEVRIEDGKAIDRNFDTYRMLRINECPDLVIEFIESTERPEGMGEITLPAAAPALANALFQLRGERIRRLPIHG